MRNFIAYLCASMVAAIVVGCGPGKELPDEITVHKDAFVVPPDPGGKVPEGSDPEAKDVVLRAIKAITEGKMESQAKARICKVTAHGKFKDPNRAELTDAVRTVTTVWPDRARTTYEFKEGLLAKRTVGLRGTFGWMYPELPLYFPPSEIAKVIAIDVTAQQWIPLSMDLTDHKAVYFGVQKKKSDKESTTSFKFGWAERTDRPVYVITCDDKSGLPVTIDYSPLMIDQRTRIRYVFSLADHKSFSGLTLPTSMSLKANDTLVESWTVDSWEFLESFDDAQFEKPKENSKK